MGELGIGYRRMRSWTGDTIWAPPGEMHWHGGSLDSYCVHTAISLGTTEWHEEVTEDDYRATPLDEVE